MQPDSPKDEPPQPPSDGVLFQALMRGEPSALAMLYDRYASLVYGLALRILQEPQAAEGQHQALVDASHDAGGEQRADVAEAARGEHQPRRPRHGNMSLLETADCRVAS